MSLPDWFHGLYSQEDCLATAMATQARCPDERALLALLLTMLAFFAVLLVYALDGVIQDLRERRSRGPRDGA